MLESFFTLKGISHEELRELYRDAVAFVFAGTEDFGMAFVESLACGTPVIAFNRGSMPEIILDRKTGFLVHNIDEALEAIQHLELINRKDCREWAKSKFSREKMIENYLEVYQKILRLQ